MCSTALRGRGRERGARSDPGRRPRLPDARARYRVSHAAVGLAARAGTLLVWVGEAGVRLYAAGQPGGARSDRLLWQARLALDEAARLKVVRRMFEVRFSETRPNAARSTSSEGSKVPGCAASTSYTRSRTG